MYDFRFQDLLIDPYTMYLVYKYMKITINSGRQKRSKQLTTTS